MKNGFQLLLLAIAGPPSFCPHTHFAMPPVQKLELEKHEMRINDLFEVEMVGDNPKLSRKH